MYLKQKGHTLSLKAYKSIRDVGEVFHGSTVVRMWKRCGLVKHMLVEEIS